MSNLMTRPSPNLNPTSAICWRRRLELVLASLVLMMMATGCKEDKIKIHATASLENNKAFVIADYRKSHGSHGCRNDHTRRTVSEAWIKNALQAGNPPCSTAIAVMAYNHALKYEPEVTEVTGATGVTGVTGWTEQKGEAHDVHLDSMKESKPVVWLARSGVASHAKDSFGIANRVYNESGVGVKFLPTYIDPNTEPPEYVDLAIDLPTRTPVSDTSEFLDEVIQVDLANSGTSTVPSITGNDCFSFASPYFWPGRLNIYFLETTGGGGQKGEWCNANENIILMYTTNNTLTLSHEIGHAYGLRAGSEKGHATRGNGLGRKSKNVMRKGASGNGRRFSAGQAFRMNVHLESQLVKNLGIPTTLQEDCPTNFVGPKCPKLSLGKR